MPLVKFGYVANRLKNLAPVEEVIENIENNSEKFNYHDNQRDAAIEITKKFYKGANYILLLAQPQVGKTGTIKAFLTNIHKNAILITGTNDNSLLKQLEEDLKDIKIFSKFEVLHNPKLQQLLRKNKVENLKEKYSDYVIVIDESHIGQDAKSTVHKFLTELGISADGSKLENDKISLVISVSATPMSEMCEENMSNKDIVILQPGNKYKSMEIMMDNDHILKGYRLFDKIQCTKFIDQLNELLVLKKKKYVVIREKDKQTKVIENITKIMNEKYKDINYCICRSDSDANDSDTYRKNIDDYLQTQPTQLTFLFVKDYLRVGKQTKTEYIIVMHDNSFTSKSDTAAQSFAGRACGYGKSKDIVYVFTNKIQIENYIKWVNSGYSNTEIPRAKNVKNSMGIRKKKEIPRRLKYCENFNIKEMKGYKGYLREHISNCDECEIIENGNEIKFNINKYDKDNIEQHFKFTAENPKRNLQRTIEKYKNKSKYYFSAEGHGNIKDINSNCLTVLVNPANKKIYIVSSIGSECVMVSETTTKEMFNKKNNEKEDSDEDVVGEQVINEKKTKIKRREIVDV
jgi:hypothetical protein